MRIVADEVRLTTPATSGNLGPGFDALGMALEIRDELRVRAVSSATRIEVTGEGAATVPLDDSHLVVRALRRGLDEVGAPQTNVELTCHNRIPHGRGLGSSAAAVVGGLLAARGLISEPEALDDRTILRLATEFEGHPDNAAPAILGGATVAWSGEDGVPQARILKVGRHVRPTVLVPPGELATSTARSVLPAEVPMSEAVFNLARSALLVHALAEGPDDLLEATDDRLHQRRRAHVMPRSLEVVTTLRELGLPAVVSGAGPSVLVFTRVPAETAKAFERHGWGVHATAVAERGAVITS